MRENERRVLVVEGDDAIRALLSTILRRRGYKVDAARNGAEGLQRTTRCRYAVVLLDLTMPGPSGDELLAEFEKRPVDERPLVFVLSAGGPPRHFHPDLVTGTIRRPFDIQLVVDSVTACLSASPERPQLESCPNTDEEGLNSQGDDKQTN